MQRLLLFTLLATTVQAITLVDKGKSSYTIVIADQAPPADRRAASELQRFIAEMSGARLPIATGNQPTSGPLILVGDSRALRQLKPPVPFETLGAEGFVLRTSGANLVIAGGAPRGTMYGVYTFLDKLGCRWFTRDISRIPAKPTITIAALSETHKPAFEYREPFFFEAWNKDWASRNRTNGDHTPLDESTGGKLKYYPFVHSFNELLPPGKYFKEHPEYYSLIDGKRRSEHSQLCLTNPDVLRLTIERVEQWIGEHPDATIFSVSQNDWEGWCECDHCRRVEAEEGGRHSGPLLRFVNAVATAIGQRHPGKLIDTIAYWYTEDPPAKVRPVQNVRIRLCPIGICVSHSFASCPRSAYFYKNLQAWSKITNQLYIWHYNTNFAHYPLPFPDFDELAADIPLYHQHGVVGLFMQGAYAPGGGGENSELRAYVLARQLWDAKTDVNKTVDEFMQGVYGAAAPAMREYFDLLHREVRGPAGRHLWIFNVPDYSGQYRQQARALLDRAAALANDEVSKRAVRKARLSVDYYDLLCDTEFDVRGDVYAPANLATLSTRARDLFRRMREFGMQSIHEGQNLDFDEKTWGEMKGLPVASIENSRWRADVVPALNGRIVRFIDKTTGKNLLRQYAVEDRAYPSVGGQMVGLHDDYRARQWDLVYQVDTQTPTQLILAARHDSGIHVRRTLTLTGEGLRTEAFITNQGTKPVPVAALARAEFSPGDIDAASMRFPRISGQAVDERFIRAGEQPTGKATWSAAERPNGTWSLVRGAGTPVTVQFANAQAERAMLNWTAKSRPGVTFGLWSKETTLQPGESIRLDATYR